MLLLAELEESGAFAERAWGEDAAAFDEAAGVNPGQVDDPCTAVAEECGGGHSSADGLLGGPTEVGLGAWLATGQQSGAGEVVLASPETNGSGSLVARASSLVMAGSPAAEAGASLQPVGGGFWVGEPGLGHAEHFTLP